MDKDLMAKYGAACVALEMAQNQYTEIKKLIIEAMNKKSEAPKDEPKAE